MSTFLRKRILDNGNPVESPYLKISCLKKVYSILSCYLWLILHLKFKILIKYGDCALHALYTGISRLKPSLACKIFDILSYNCKIWVAYKKQDFKTWDSSPTEKTHLHFCKRYLEVSNKLRLLMLHVEAN